MKPFDDPDPTTGDRILELADLEVDVEPAFLDRIRRRLDRRMSTSHVLALAWFLPAAILLEFLTMAFGIFDTGPREGGSP